MGDDIVNKLLGLIAEVVETTPDGVPGGLIYASLMGLGISLAQYEYLMEKLVSDGRVVKRGQLYFKPKEKAHAAPG